MSNTYPFELNDATTLVLAPQEGDDRIKVRVEQTINDTEETAYSALHAKDFYDVPQKRKTIANEIAEKAAYAPEDTKAAFLGWCEEFGATDEGEDRKRAMRSPVVNQLLDETEAVKVYGGEETLIEVELSHGGHSGAIEFTPSEWTGRAAGKLTSAYYNEFFEKVQVTGEDFEELTDEWDEQKEIVSRESITGWETVASRVLSGLQTQVRRTVHEKKQTIKNDEYGAWFDASESEPIVWVRSTGVVNELEDAGRGAGEVSQLSAEFKKRSITARSTKKVCGQRCYPIYADVLEITEADVHTNDEDDDQVVEP